LKMFSDMIDTIYNSSLAKSIFYINGIGEIIKTTAIINNEHKDSQFFETRTSLPYLTIEVKASSISMPDEMDIVKMGGETYRVRKYDIDSEKLVWKLDLDRLTTDNNRYA
jgi:hypothetical protein